MLKKLFSHTIIYGLAPQISKVVGFILLPIITQYLTDIDFGVYGTVMAYVGALSIFSNIGLRLILINSFYYYPVQYKWLWRQLYGFLNLWNIVFSIVLGLILYFTLPNEAVDNRFLIVLLNVLPILFFGQISMIGMTYYQLKQKPMQIALRTSVFGVLSLCLSAYLIVYYRMGYMGWFWGLAVSNILSNFSYWYPINKIYKLSPIYNFKWRTIKESLKVSLPIVPHHYSGFLVESSDRVVMNWYRVLTADIGKYNIAYMFGTVFSALGTAVGYAVSPMYNQLYKEKKDKEVRSLMFTLQIGFFILSFIVCLWLREIFIFFVKNESLQKMYYLAIIIIMSYNYKPMYLASVSKLFYLQKTSKLWTITLTAGIINLVLNLLLIPYFGFEAAAYTTYISLMYMGYAGFFYKIYKEFSSVEYYPLGWLVLTIVITILGYTAVELNLFLKIIITLVLVLIIIFVIFKKNKKNG